MKNFLITQLNRQMRLIVGEFVREGELIVVTDEVAHLKVPTHTISIRIAGIDIAEAIVV